MSEKPLLLSSAKSGILLPTEHTSAVWSRRVVTALGCVVIVVGGVDIVNKAGHLLDTSGISNFLPRSIAFTAFAPAAAIVDPSLLNSVTNGVSPTTIDAFVPLRLKISSIGVDAKVESVGKKTDGSMETPKNINNVGWYSLGSRVGEKGNAVFAGHVNNGLNLDGVFAHLSDVKVGDYVSVSSYLNAPLIYVVTQINQYPLDNAPSAEIFTTTGPPQLVLITCDGDWMGSQHTFTKRLVVVARLMHP